VAASLNDGDSARARLRAFFEAHVGEVLTHAELAPVGRISSWQRRVRELREDEGMRILTHHDRTDLRPGEYMLASLDRVPRSQHHVDRSLRARVLERDGFTCQLCGLGAGDADPYTAGRTVRLHVDHIDPNGPAEEGNLRTLCSSCNEGRSNLAMPRSTINLLSAVRRAGRDEQRAVYEMLREKFETPS
jgi:5-methylcytosine-specific restriction endonuclease McrA